MQKQLQFKELKIGDKFTAKFLYFWKNNFGTFHENVIGEFEKVDEKFAYCNEYETGLNFSPNTLVCLE